MEGLRQHCYEIRCRIGKPCPARIQIECRTDFGALLNHKFRRLPYAAAIRAAVAVGSFEHADGSAVATCGVVDGP